MPCAPAGRGGPPPVGGPWVPLRHRWWTTWRPPAGCALAPGCVRLVPTSGWGGVGHLQGRHSGSVGDPPGLSDAETVPSCCLPLLRLTSPSWPPCATLSWWSVWPPLRSRLCCSPWGGPVPSSAPWGSVAHAVCPPPTTCSTPSPTPWAAIGNAVGIHLRPCGRLWFSGGAQSRHPRHAAIRPCFGHADPDAVAE